tara:strand:- start:314 stop:1069 length:756 start_codon:yes stop_codon:yes gene_type:complete
VSVVSLRIFVVVCYVLDESMLGLFKTIASYTFNLSFRPSEDSILVKIRKKKLKTGRDFSQINLQEWTRGCHAYTALDYAIIHGLPEVALEIVLREDFTMVNNVSPDYKSCLILAAERCCDEDFMPRTEEEEAEARAKSKLFGQSYQSKPHQPEFSRLLFSGNNNTFANAAAGVLSAGNAAGGNSQNPNVYSLPLKMYLYLLTPIVTIGRMLLNTRTADGIFVQKTFKKKSRHTSSTLVNIDNKGPLSIYTF